MLAIEQTLWWAHVSVSEMLRPMFATCLVRSQTCLLRLLHVWSEAKHVCYEKRAFGRPDRNELNELQSSSQIVSRAGADADRPLLLFIPMWVILKCCSLCLLHVWSEATHKAIYSISLLIITHHYSSLRNSLLIITHHYSNSITHRYSPLHYLRWVKKSLRCLKIWCHKTMHTWPLLMKIEGGGWPPPPFLCVMMSKKEIYE